jgi:Rod binding domain-containing protein
MEQWMIHTSDLRLNSSQGKRERPFRFAVSKSRMLLETGNSSIQLIILSVTLCAAAFGATDRVRAVGDNFEALFLQHLYEQMQKSGGLSENDPDNPFSPSHAELVYRSMLNQELMKGVAARRPLGVSDLVVRQLQGQGRIRK